MSYRHKLIEHAAPLGESVLDSMAEKGWLLLSVCSGEAVDISRGDIVKKGFIHTFRRRDWKEPEKKPPAKTDSDT
jgi:hypothetical protein